MHYDHVIPIFKGSRLGNYSTRPAPAKSKQAMLFSRIISGWWRRRYVAKLNKLLALKENELAFARFNREIGNQAVPFSWFRHEVKLATDIKKLKHAIERNSDK